MQKEGRTLSSNEMVGFYEELVDSFPIVSIEDGLDQNDWEGWQILTDRLGDRVQLVGDDLFVTNTSFLRRGIDRRNDQLDPHQAQSDRHAHRDTRAVEMAKTAGYTAVVSHRSGETDDTTISDLVVATNAGQIKTGAPARGERVAKYNRLMLD